MLLPVLPVLAALLPVGAGTLPAPVEVFVKGENITGFNPAGDKRAYQCFRIPQLLALPSGKILAFAEGRADGCRPDGRVNRPIVVRPSADAGKTWGPISIAGPAMPHSSTNYPGAFLRGNTTVALRYDSANGTLETTSTDEGSTWSSPVVASQPPGNITCGSAWPKMLGSDIILACGAGHTGRSTDGGRSWVLSTTPVALSSNVSAMGENMVVADGRTPKSLTMMIRATSRSRWLNHAVAQSTDAGDSWNPARLLPIAGSTCEGSIGRDAHAPPGQVMLSATYGGNRFRLGRANMSVFSFDAAAAGSEPVPVLNVWPNAAGYSDFSQQQLSGGKLGPLLLLFEGGGGTYDYGIKISPIAL